MKLAIITGASRGIGYAIGKKLSENYQVINLSRTPIDEFINYQVDIRNPLEIKNVFKTIVKKYGTPSILVNNAGYVDPKGILAISYEEWQKTININLTGVFLCTKEFVKYTKKTGGKIINIASTAGTRAQPGWSAYAASKAGVINFSLTMAEELKNYYIKVYCLAPGRCATDLRRKLAPDEDQSKIMQPEDVAELVHYLVSKDKFIDGQPIVVKQKDVE